MNELYKQDNLCAAVIPKTLDPSILDWYNLQVKTANPIVKTGALDAKIISSMNPIDSIDGMLMTQMVATHNVLMTLLIRAGIEAKSVSDKLPCNHAATKLMHAFARQVETLNQYRGNNGSNGLIVKQVNVEAGGKAVVGNVTNNAAKN